MAKKKTQPKKKKRTKSKKRAVTKEIKKIIFGIIILIFIVLTAAMVADIFLGKTDVKEEVKKTAPDKDQTEKMKSKEEKKSAEKPEKPPDQLKEKPEDRLQYEVFEDKKEGALPDDTETDTKKPPLKVIHEKGRVPKIAIIIDDIGYDIKHTEALATLDENLTFSILPGSPFGKKFAEKLRRRGFHLMLHLPMEPVEYPEVDPGSNALLSEMSPDELIAQLRRNLDEIPHIEGVNNHMGSKLTTISEKMNQIFSILKKRDLFFIDSITSNKSMCSSSANLLKVKFAKRDVFIDNVQEEAYINGQLEQLVRKAQKEGEAIGIAHPYAATFETFKKSLPRLKNRVQIVPASALKKLSDERS